MQNDWIYAALLAWGGGLSIPLGALLFIFLRKRLGRERTFFNHLMTAVGGGALLSAVALVLVPDGMENQNQYVGVLSFALGGVAFTGVDYLLSKSKGAGPQIVAMLSDFVPEAIALGAIFLKDQAQGVLLAFIMFIQNLPEGYNAFSEFPPAKKSKTPYLRTTLIFGAMSFVGPICAWLGTSVLADNETVLGFLMTFSGGGITYLIFRDIAPAAKFKNSYVAPLGSILGFAIGLLGWALVN
ncbi:MAG: divalent cation transporter [Flavobacteriia bacterium]|nr:divalent cation transporter [Flavobacteriia bacterium]